MAVIKCKMCGGDMELSLEKTFGICEYCGSTMTLPKVSDEQRTAAFNRGNHFRRMGEFDKALAVYERIVAEDDTDAEAHWCCALCRYGIEYVEDPVSYEWLPTCHRASFDSFLEDVDYLAALEHSDGITRRQYQKDAAKIAEVQRGILATSQNTATAYWRRTSTISSPKRAGACSSPAFRWKMYPAHSMSLTYSPRSTLPRSW